MKDAIAVLAFTAWLSLNLWLWTAELSIDRRFWYSLPLGVLGFGGFFGYMSWRNKE